MWKRIKWPGIAAVTVSSIHIFRGSWSGVRHLDSEPVNQITAFLFASGSSDDPLPLHSNAGRSFEGFKIAGQGFVFDDDDEEASPLNEMERLLVNPKNRELILPYIGGEEVNDSPTHTFHRYVIDFDSLEETEAAHWPELLEIVRAKVKPYRDTVNREAHRKRWWIYGERRPGLRAALHGKTSVLVCSLHQQHWLLSFLPSKLIFSHGIGVFVFEHPGALAVLQSRAHEVWARFFASSLEDRLRYTPSDCFETFPFPAGFETNAALEAAGREYYEFRAALMQDLWLGLTEIYNLFHAPDDEGLEVLRKLYGKRRLDAAWRVKERVPEDKAPMTEYPTPEKAMEGIRMLRVLHAKMDDAVLRAYGWDDLAATATCEFLLDYEDDDEALPASPSPLPSSRRRKLPWRYRWPDEFRDEVLARLLKLNAQRAEEERLKGMSKGGGSPPSPPKPRRGRRAPDATGPVQPAEPDLFG